MSINEEWQNRQEKHIPPKSQSSLESLKTNSKTESVAEKKSHNNKEALNLHFRITGWMMSIQVNIVLILKFCKYYKKLLFM